MLLVVVGVLTMMLPAFSPIETVGAESRDADDASQQGQIDEEAVAAVDATIFGEKQEVLDDYPSVEEAEMNEIGSWRQFDHGDHEDGASQDDNETSDDGTDPSDDEHVNPYPIHVVTETRKLQGLIHDLHSPGIGPPLLFVVLAYREDCEFSMQLLWKYQYVIREIMVKEDAAILERLDPIFLQLPVNPGNVDVLDQFGLKHVPVLFFVKEQGLVPRLVSSSSAEEKGDNQQQDDEKEKDGATVDMVPIFYAVQYRGLTSTVQGLADGMYHYLTRLRHSFISTKTNTVTNKDYHDALTIQVASLNQLRHDILEAYRGKVVQRAPPIPLDPHFSQEEDQWIRYLMDDDIDDTDTNGIVARDPMYIVCQCRRKGVDGSETPEPPKYYNGQEEEPLLPTMYREFDEIAHVLSARRDALFCVLQDECEFINAINNANEDGGFDGSVAAFTVHPETDWALQQTGLLLASDNTNSSDWISAMLRPSVMWLDRRMTAPIAFHPRYHLHAVLFVDFLDRSTAEDMRDAVQLLRRECQEERRRNGDDSLVCLVVPSTDTRVLTTFGIDIWTRMDEYATKIISAAKCKNDNTSEECKRAEGLESKEDDFLSPPPPVLPTLLLAHRRHDGTGIQRYYLDPPITKDSLQTFLMDFRSGNATPEIKSKDRDSKTPQTSTHGIHILTGSTLPSFLLDHEQKHVLLQFYAPTCGHCKRFNIIWNGLGELLEYLGWDDRVVLARMDVTSNEFFVPGLTSSWLPDMFYFGLGVTENPVRFEETEIGRKVALGAFSDPLDVLEWWLDQAGSSVDEAALLQALEEGSTG